MAAGERNAFYWPGSNLDIKVIEKQAYERSKDVFHPTKTTIHFHKADESCKHRDHKIIEP